MKINSRGMYPVGHVERMSTLTDGYTLVLDLMGKAHLENLDINGRKLL